MFIAIGFITCRMISHNGVKAKPYIQSYLSKHDDGEFDWLRNGRASLVLDRHLLVSDTKYNRFVIMPDYFQSTKYPSGIVFGDNGHGSTNNIGIIDIDWFDGMDACLISVDTKNSRIFYRRGDIILFDVNHDGVWDIKSNSTNKWYFLEGNWYPKIGEDSNGSIVSVGGTNYNIKFNTQGSILRPVGAVRE